MSPAAKVLKTRLYSAPNPRQKLKKEGKEKKKPKLKYYFGAHSAGEGGSEEPRRQPRPGPTLGPAALEATNGSTNGGARHGEKANAVVGRCRHHTKGGSGTGAAERSAKILERAA